MWSPVPAGIQPRKGDLAVQGILVLTVSFGWNFKAGNEECSQPETCHIGCRVSSSSQGCFKGCLGPVWAGSFVHKQEEISPQSCSMVEKLGCFLLCPDKFVHTLLVSRLKPGAGVLSFSPSEINPCGAICPGPAVFLPRVRDSRYRNAIPSSTPGAGWTG